MRRKIKLNRLQSSWSSWFCPISRDHTKVTFQTFSLFPRISELTKGLTLTVNSTFSCRVLRMVMLTFGTHVQLQQMNSSLTQRDLSGLPLSALICLEWISQGKLVYQKFCSIKNKIPQLFTRLQTKEISWWSTGQLSQRARMQSLLIMFAWPETLSEVLDRHLLLKDLLSLKILFWRCTTSILLFGRHRLRHRKRQFLDQLTRSARTTPVERLVQPDQALFS